MSSGTPPLTTIPLEIFDLEKCIEDGEKFWEFEPLKSLDLSFNKITVIPGEICSLVDCVSMKFRDNLIQELPEGLFEGCISVKHLDLGMNKVTALSARVCNLTYLKDLLMPHNNLTSLPDTLFECRSIVNLDVEHNKLRALPQRWAMAALVTLNVANNTLAALPPCLAEVLSLEVLNCGSNSIAQLPDLSRLVNLKYLDASQNVLEAFPRLPRENSRNQLSHLLLGYNRISSIDIDALTHHKALSELLLHNNRLQEVPGEIEYIASLKIIDVANNDLRDLPPTLGYMPNLQHIRAEGNPIRVIRQQVLLKPVNELKAHLRGRGPSLLEAALIQVCVSAVCVDSCVYCEQYFLCGHAYWKSLYESRMVRNCKDSPALPNSSKNINNTVLVPHLSPHPPHPVPAGPGQAQLRGKPPTTPLSPPPLHRCLTKCTSGSATSLAQRWICQRWGCWHCRLTSLTP